MGIHIMIEIYAVISDCTGNITDKGDVLIKIGKAKKKKISTEVDAIQLSIFSHRFMSLAEQMGRYVFHYQYAIKINKHISLDFWHCTQLFVVCINIIPCLQNPTENFNFNQHQGETRLLMCPLWSRWRAGVQCSSYSCPPWSNAGDCSVPGKYFLVSIF